MGRIWTFLLVALTGGTSLLAQTSAVPEPPPQSARQALIEMFLGKGAGDFEKHLPDATRHALIRKGDTPANSAVLKIATAGHELVSLGEHIETFDVGPTLLVSEQNKGREKIEVVVEHDSLMGDEDEIELSFQSYKDGKLEFLPVVPRLIFTFKQEKEIWRLTEITAAAHVPLTDPDYLKNVRKQQDEALESQVQMRLMVISSTEKSYAAAHPERGYTCTLGNLFQQEPTTPTAVGPDPGMANEEYNGYRIALAGCEGTPSPKYRLSAVPVEPESGMKTFCISESGPVRFVTGGKSSSCFSQGQPVGAEAPASED